LNALWFGHPTNIIYLIEFLRKFENSKIEKLTIVTSKLNQKDQEFIKSLNKKIKYEFYEWEINFYQKKKLKCNISLIPSDTSDGRKNGVSNNRLITSIALGLVPVVTIVDSYKEYSEYLLNIDEITSAEKYVNINSLLIKKQKQILENYKSDVIQKKWLDLILMGMKKI
jgi:hypothetical protein